VDAIARHEAYQQVTWYACAPVGDDMAAIVLACKLARDCMSIKVDDGDSGYFGPAFLMKPSEAAGHISIELCDHVVNTTLFMACLSPIMQVCSQRHASDLLDALAVARGAECPVETLKSFAVSQARRPVEAPR
jgi:hypothetical protein